MKNMQNNDITKELKNKPKITNILKPYKLLIGTLFFLTVASSGLGLLIPKIISRSIDSFVGQSFSLTTLLWEFGLVAFFAYLANLLQNLVQTYASEKVARDLRDQISNKISEQSLAFVEQISAEKLLTNLTADIDSIKYFVSLAIPSIISSMIVIVGASALLLSIDWELGLAVLTMVPAIGLVFFVLFGRVRILFKKGREVLDRLNRIINESIFGAGIIRVLDSKRAEFGKFNQTNEQAQTIGIGILTVFASLIPLVTFIASLATLIVLALGGHFVITGGMTIGSFTAFNSYIMLLIFPIIMLGFMSNLIAQATSSYERISEVLDASPEKPAGTLTKKITGKVSLENITLKYGQKSVLKNISLEIKPKTKTAIIGPTAAGKSQLLHLLIGLIEPTLGQIAYDDQPLKSFDPINLHEQIGLVFQDSIIFNLTLRENIAFKENISEDNLNKAIQTAELTDFIASLPQGLETIISERGGSLSGGQKQRIMLARALALNPQILLLDDFTARVDDKTEKKILANIAANYQDMTVISVTQKISAITDYDQIIVLMEGEKIASGTHTELLQSSPEYVQIFDSQKSTNEYE